MAKSLEVPVDHLSALNISLEPGLNIHIYIYIDHTDPRSSAPLQCASAMQKVSIFLSGYVQNCNNRNRVQYTMIAMICAKRTPHTYIYIYIWWCLKLLLGAH